MPSLQAVTAWASPRAKASAKASPKNKKPSSGGGAKMTKKKSPKAPSTSTKGADAQSWLALGADNEVEAGSFTAASTAMDDAAARLLSEALGQEKTCCRRRATTLP